MPFTARRILTAKWQHLIMLNYEIDPAALVPLVPRGTELDFWHGRTFVSVVGFMFKRARLFGVPIPFHQNFEEVNLRFYVRRFDGGQRNRGVVFVKELVPRAAIAWTARLLYNEPYDAVPMDHCVEFAPERNQPPRTVTYSWTNRGRRQSVSMEVGEGGELPVDGSAEEFITEHYWGYTRQRDGGTLEYRVEHPRWRVWSARQARLECDVRGLYGEAFVPWLEQSPTSVFLAEGSDVSVFRGTRLPQV